MSKENYSTQYIGYISQLEREHAWKFQRPTSGEISSSLVAYHDENTVSLVRAWRESGDPVEISIVVVVPNGSILGMPARALGYVASALSLSREAISKWGLNISSLRILSPCNVNEFCDGGNLVHKLSSAEKLKLLVQLYKENCYPDLSGVDVLLDTGKPIDEHVVEALRPKVEQIKTEQPILAKELADIAGKHARRSTSNRPLDESLLPLVYLLAHPEAWGYSPDNILFEKNGNSRINYMPGSELRYLEYMSRVDNIWARASDHQIATMLAEGYQTAPYYKGSGSEPLIQDLSYGNLTDLLRYYRSGYSNLEAIPAIQQLVTDISQKTPKSLKEIISELSL